MSLHERLRAETRAAHEEAERVLDLPVRLASRGRYLDLLRGIYELHAAFEAGAGSLLADTPFAPALDGTRRLARDFRALAETPPPFPPAERFATLPDAIGAAYVFEGSRLGSLLIAREVQRRLGIRPDTGGFFLAGDGKATAARWAAFRGALDAASDPAHDDRVVLSALRTFATVASRFTAAPARSAA